MYLTHWEGTVKYLLVCDTWNCIWISVCKTTHLQAIIWMKTECTDPFRSLGQEVRSKNTFMSGISLPFYYNMLSKIWHCFLDNLGWVGLWGFLWWAPSAKRKDHHGVSSRWSSVWHRSNTVLSSTQYEQIPIILGVWPFWLTPFFFRSITFWRACG